MARTKKDKVLARLQAADGWVCHKTLKHPQIGGLNARNRVSELRQAGYAIVSETCRCVQCRHSRLVSIGRNESPTYVAAYRLVEAAKARAS